MTHIIPREVRNNNFDKDTFRQIKGLLENIPSELFESKNVAKIGKKSAMQPNLLLFRVAGGRRR